MILNIRGSQLTVNPRIHLTLERLFPISKKEFVLVTFQKGSVLLRTKKASYVFRSKKSLFLFRSKKDSSFLASLWLV